MELTHRQTFNIQVTRINFLINERVLKNSNDKIAGVERFFVPSNYAHPLVSAQVAQGKFSHETMKRFTSDHSKRAAETFYYYKRIFTHVHM